MANVFGKLFGEKEPTPSPSPSAPQEEIRPIEEVALTDVTASPVYSQGEVIKKMDFPAAMREIIKGRVVTRQEWDNKAVYALMKDDLLMIRMTDGVFYKWEVIKADMIAEDWIVLPGSN